MKQLTNVTRVVGLLNKCYRKINEQLFDSELPPVQVVLINSSRVYGQISINNVWQTVNGEGQREICISKLYIFLYFCIESDIF